MEELTTPTPQGDATPPVESTPAVPREPDGKFAPKTPPVAEPSATPDAEAPKAEALKPDEHKDEPAKRNRAQERIDRITAEKHAAIREATALRQRLEALQQAPRPQIDPNDYDAQQRESMRSVIREEQIGQTAQQYEDAQRRAQQAQVDTFYSKVEAARERIPDLDRSIQEFSRLPVSAHAAEIIAESDVAAEMAHYLATNPREAYDIANMTPAQQGRALARIEQRVSLPTRRTSTAPPPPPIVTGAQAALARTPAEMSAAEYVAHRKQQWAKGGR